MSRVKNICQNIWEFYLVVILGLYLRNIEELYAVSFLVVGINGVVNMKLVVM